jgi:hypothetical protein
MMKMKIGQRRMIAILSVIVNSNSAFLIICRIIISEIKAIINPTKIYRITSIGIISKIV